MSASLDILKFHWHSFCHRFEKGDYANFKEAEDIANAIMVGLCIVCGATAAGLTVGLLSLDAENLRHIIIKNDGSKEFHAAKKVFPFLKQHHLLLVTLLLFNSLANETLPVFVGALVPNWLAIILSVLIVLFFCEVIPTAIFTGRNKLIIAARCVSLVSITFRT